MKTIKKSAIGLFVLVFAVGSFGFMQSQKVSAATTWNTTGDYVINFNYLGTDYPHDMFLLQDGSNDLTGHGGSPAGGNTYEWTITSGNVTDNTIHFSADYTATQDAVIPQTTMNVMGTIAGNGKISGTWSDNYADGERVGTFSTEDGAAIANEPNASTVKVTIQKYVDGHMATAQSANNYDFPMSSTWNAENTGAGTGEYSLSKNGYGGDTTPYQAVTSYMTSGADYTTHEITTTPAVGTSCEITGTNYALLGYTYGNTLNEAKYATRSLVAPNFTNMTSDKFVIVWNDDCLTENVGGEIGGDLEGEVVVGNGMLEVTNIEMINTTANANNSFENGWKYIFSITVPTDETDISMKFANWARTSGSEMIPAGTNMRISSDQANNAGATVMITSANTYSTPTLTMVTDLDPSMDGLQVKVIVEVKIPTGSANGSYTTSYGVKSE